MRYLLYVFILFNYTANAQIETSVYPESPFTDLYNIEVGDNYIYTSGSCDVIMFSSDKGATWTYLNSEGSVIDIDIVPNSNESKAYYLTSNKIYVFDAVIKEYNQISDDNLQLSAGRFRSIIIRNNTIYLISNGSIHKATIGDYQWEKFTDFEFGNDYVRYTDITENYIWVGTDKGKIIKVNIADGTKTETKDFVTRIGALEMVNDNLGYIVVSGLSNIQKTIDGGFQFSPLGNMPETINPVAWGEDLVMSINTNRFYVSSDGGQTSTYTPVPQDGYTNLISAYQMTSEGVLYLAGNSGMVMKTEDFGQTFIHLNAFKRENLQDIEFNTVGEGYAVGGNSTIIHTIDKGKTWNPVDLSLSDEETFIQTVISVNQNRFLIGHNRGISIIDNGIVLKTISGSCDLLLKSITGDYLMAIRQVGGDYVVSKSADGGDSWVNKINLPTYPNDLQESASGQIFIPGEAGTFITSKDGGETWSIINVEGIDKRIQKLKFLDEDLGLLSTGNNLYITKDGGNTAQISTTDYSISNIYLFNENHFMITTGLAGKTTIKESINEGTWETTGSYCAKTNKSYYDGDKTVWLAQEGGHINKHTILDISSTKTIHSKNKLKVFPNPIFSGQLMQIDSEIEFEQGKIIESSTGRVIKKLSSINNNQINTETLNSGLYILEISNREMREYIKFVVY